VGGDQDPGDEESGDGVSRQFDIINVPQRSPEWFQARVGRLTGSRASDMLASIKTGEAAARRDLRVQLVVERLTGVPQEDGYINGAMQRGIECEPLARAAYEARTGSMVQTTGFLAHTELLAGCSLDGQVDDFTGIVELKCPKSATHLRWLKAGEVPPEHRPQLLHHLWITGAQWADFLSFDDRFPAALQTFLIRLPRVEIEILAYEKTVLKFLVEVDAELATIGAVKVA
jgi:hypothetical protein